ncbi:threonine--tRNA ligase [Candidatus Woesebacteria bacterium RIFCSPLOWO2_01_FULL_43_11]|uniref:Threonine--tRNA ligase n=1 Tax=Candidatus Woesebacteria bacterium RBG_16_42_24 TaxID=1802485 RepID=A0A1F7XK31_9BACT|nr:MAG: threonine--tRNA ligase [Candidatus Woesebacteria bacterium RBG_16_42_24]OGM67393.1 MAG: threonine--tRNA ligase [Candidatus Woesebacteria bacterium RIFCSPLOWO2_01_FULL_43_11]
MATKNNLDNLRHSTSHLLAAAVTSLWPNAKPTLGPPIENGFYYDFDFADTKISEEDLVKIEEKMHQLVKDWKEFRRFHESIHAIKERFKDNQYKLELIREFEKDNQDITVYQSGNFIDLCRGGHIDNPAKEIKYFKLLSVAGAYWRGSEKNTMLTRIYGTIFATQKELDKYLADLEEAKKRDHRKIGKELELFTISEEVGPGLVLWLPKGNIIKEEIEKWAKETEEAWGYQRVTTPNITKSGLYFTSGHLPYYKDDMYPPMKGEGGEEYYLKPMNCPHHHMIYKSKVRSYKELPLRLAEYGTCYRYEASGELFGMMRVRGFSQNDSHIYCTPEQAVGEFVNVMRLHEYYYKTLGITEYHLVLSLRDPTNKKKYHGDEDMWKLAEGLMREAAGKVDIKMVEDIGSAAFYGPKIDFVIRSSIGREFGISTNQIDLFMGKRFNLKYVDKSGKEETPVIIHRAPLGSHERFIAFLIEHWGGNFPVWLSPVQVKVLPITDKNLSYAKSVWEKLKENGIRAELDERNERLQAKIRDAQIQKIPYMLILGDKEEKEKTVSVRGRSGKDSGALSIDKFIGNIRKEIETKSL